MNALLLFVVIISNMYDAAARSVPIQTVSGLVEGVSGVFQNLSGLLVQVEHVSGKAKETNSENPGEEWGDRGGSDVVHSLAQLRDDGMDHFTSTGVNVGGLDVLLAPNSLFVKVSAKLRDSSVVVVVVVVIIVVVSVVVVVDEGARHGSGGNQRLSGEGVSVVHLFVSSLGSVLGAGRISEDSSVDTRRSAVSSSVVNSVVVVAVGIVVLVVSAFFFVHGLTFGELVEFLFTFFFGAVVVSLLRKTGVDAVLFVVAVVLVILVVVVVVVVVVVGVIIVVVLLAVVVVVVGSVLAAVFANLRIVLAFVFARFLQGVLVSFDELSHLNNVLSSVAARSVGAKLELGNQVGSESFFALEHGDGSATIELEVSSANPRVVGVVVVLELTGLSEDALSQFGVGADGSVDGDSWGDQGEEGERKAELHFRIC